MEGPLIIILNFCFFLLQIYKPVFLCSFFFLQMTFFYDLLRVFATFFIRLPLLKLLQIVIQLLIIMNLYYR